MANFNAMFAGCESFMEGDVEINNDVTVPDSGEALEAETVAEDVGAEGGEIVGDAETDDTKAEAANMVFDQVLNMYRHVKQNGIDRTFLSLYNNQGQLNSMIGYRFPSCESIDSVGSPRSSASQAFIAAMESDGIFTKIWEWIKEKWAAIINFFRKVMDWFREACGNLDLRVGKLRKYFANSTDKKVKDVKNKTVKYFTNDSIKKYNESIKKVADELSAIRKAADMTTNVSFSEKNIIGICTGAGEMQVCMADYFKAAGDGARARAGKDGTYGSDKDSGDKDGHGQLKKYIDRLNKDALEPLAENINEFGNESEELSKVDGKGSIGIILNHDEITGTGKVATVEEQDSGVKKAMKETLDSCADILKQTLKMKQGMDAMKRANEQAQQSAEQMARHATGESRGYDATRDAKESTLGAVKMFSVYTKVVNLLEKLVAKTCKVAASYTSCVSANGVATGAADKS
jgi:hypothetical protein